MKTIGLLVFLVVIIAATPSQVFADSSFPHDGATLAYSVTTTGQVSSGSIVAVTNDSYKFSKLADGWSVTETMVGEITCSPSSATLSVKYRTISDIMGQNAAASSNPNILIEVSYVVKDRVVASTPIGPNVPAGYSATCNFGGTAVASISQATPALSASVLKYYTLVYIQPAGVVQGSSVPVSIIVATISGTQNLQVLGKSLTALVGTISGLATGTMYWESTSGILLLEKDTSGMQTEQMQLTASPDLASANPVPEYPSAGLILIAILSLMIGLVIMRKRMK